jgi:3-methyl-2-oxobutanoate hydroxymethyltransferase
MAGFTAKPPKLAKAYRNLRKELLDATKEFAEEVRAGSFPSERETFH